MPKVVLSSGYKSKKIIGVVTENEEDAEKRNYSVGNFVFPYNKLETDNRIQINCAGNGAIWVLSRYDEEVLDPIENGDLVCSSELKAGYSIKQDDDIIHNYTAAKILINCEFSLNSELYSCVEFAGIRCAFLPCIYMT